ncbi:MAG: GerMN domain-containing protein [Intestinimonas sp.]
MVLSGGEDQPLYLTVKLFFPRRSGGLAAEERNVLLTEQDTPVTAVLNALLSGPETQGLFFLFPEEAHILSAWVENGNCYVDFDAPFLDREPESAAQAQQLLYAIVNTLCQLPDVGAVQILVEGEAPERYGEIPTSSPLEANKDLVVD